MSAMPNLRYVPTPEQVAAAEAFDRAGEAAFKGGAPEPVIPPVEMPEYETPAVRVKGPGLALIALMLVPFGAAMFAVGWAVVRWSVGVVMGDPLW